MMNKKTINQFKCFEKINIQNYTRMYATKKIQYHNKIWKQMYQFKSQVEKHVPYQIWEEIEDKLKEL